MRRKLTRRSDAAAALKRNVTLGTRNEKPASTKNAAPKPSHGGPVVSAKNDSAAATYAKQCPPRTTPAKG